jgi:hypothetical protein
MSLHTLMTATPARILSEPVVFGIIYLGTIIIIGIATGWVYYDAKEREIRRGWAWASAVGILSLLGGIPGILVFIIYLIHR